MAKVLAVLLSGRVTCSHCMQQAQNAKLKTMTIYLQVDKLSEQAVHQRRSIYGHQRHRRCLMLPVTQDQQTESQ